MKYFKVIFISIMLSMFLFTGCDSNHPKKGEVLICGHSDSVTEIHAPLEYRKWRGIYTDRHQPEIIDLSFHDLELSGVYQSSETVRGSYDTEHEYKDNKNQYFRVTDNGELTWFSAVRNKTTVSIPKTEEECVEIALAFVAKISNVDLSNYHRVIEYNEDLRIYTIRHTKYVRDLETADSISVQVTDSGYVNTYRSTLLGKISVDQVPDFNLDEIRKSVEVRLDELTEDAKKVYDAVEYSFEYYTIGMINPTQYCMIVTVDVRCITMYGEVKGQKSERLSFMIPLN